MSAADGPHWWDHSKLGNSLAFPVLGVGYRLRLTWTQLAFALLYILLDWWWVLRSMITNPTYEKYRSGWVEFVDVWFFLFKIWKKLFAWPRIWACNLLENYYHPPVLMELCAHLLRGAQPKPEPAQTRIKLEYGNHSPPEPTKRLPKPTITGVGRGEQGVPRLAPHFSSYFLPFESWLLFYLEQAPFPNMYAFFLWLVGYWSKPP